MPKKKAVSAKAKTLEKQKRKELEQRMQVCAYCCWRYWWRW